MGQGTGVLVDHPPTEAPARRGRPNLVRQKLEASQPVLGAALQIDSPWLVEILALAGFDYVLLDGEHGFALRNLPVLVMAAQGAGIEPVVRVPSHDRGFLLQALEAGAAGVQVPMVETAAEAARLVEETKYAPLGRRGFSGATRAARYGSRTSEEVAELGNRDTLLVVQLETVRAVANAAEIAAVPGVDVVFVGPADLAQSMGLVPPEGNPTDPRLLEVLRRTFGACRRHVPVGSSVFSAEQVPVLARRRRRLLPLRNYLADPHGARAHPHRLRARPRPGNRSRYSGHRPALASKGSRT